MAVIHSFDNDSELLPEEIDTINHLTKLPIESLHLESIAVVTNIYRIAQGLRNKMEREVLADYGLSWTAFPSFMICGYGKALKQKELQNSQQ